ncbi:1-acyl-sn-glycerol-3-phosphate acyltransferase [Inhella gelatinilytica]|uniref:1-acyl-sn-glycerol-3-phosphate acyltransferase n=1 Tax=Inhella gelatinilytica TaxID=2795030 RepID=A0A931NET7_9BURK|nr:1-acyl-sn-glycerol-3-phosphate acyltransferase [Inhella gelatinilytica]MBH9554044.1 1-acyl-sn-glycerol-3-phosphate acyltransferase [Inhella gelatinilytica]
MTPPLQRLTGRAEFKPRGSALARGLLRLFGWKILFEGFPGPQGVVMVYPHTSNWDFVLGVLVKWALGVQVRWWGKDSLFKIPLLGAWARWIGGIPVDRKNPKGLVGATAEQVRQAKARGEYFWLAVAPEGTRSYVPGWRGGAYHVAVQAGVPCCLAYFDVPSKTFGVVDFVILSGDAETDFSTFRSILSDKQGFKPHLASPIQLR